MSTESNLCRRVVTGYDEEGKSTIIMDGPVPQNTLDINPGRVANWVWRENEVPATIDIEDRMQGFKVNELFDYNKVLCGFFRWEPGAGYPMHATQTVDVLFILSGRIELILEKGSTILGPGDCVVQRGTRHAWRVSGDVPLVMAGIALARKDE